MKTLIRDSYTFELEEADITISYEVIDAEKARRYLEDSGKNRPITSYRVKQLKEDIKSGDWGLIHQGIAFNEYNQLIDGQHRLTAIVEAGVAIGMFVFRGIPQSSFGLMDQHKVRNAPDLHALLGGDYSKSVMPIARAMYLGLGKRGRVKSGRSSQLMAEFALKYADIINPIYDHLKKVPFYSGPIAAAFANAAAVYGLDSVIPSLERLRDQLFDATDDPMMKLNDYMLRSGIRGPRNATVRPVVKYAYAVSAVRAAVENRPLKSLMASKKDFIMHEIEDK